MVPISPSGGEAMDTSEDFQLELNRPSSSGLRFHLHPLVMISISDQYVRTKVNNLQVPGSEGRVLGILLGQQNGRLVDISNSFELAYHKDNGSILIDDILLQKRIEQYKAVFPKLDVVGWYSTGSKLLPEDMAIHRTVMILNESPVYLLFDATIDQMREELPLLLYESELHTINGVPQHIFVRAKLEIETSEAERIAVNQVAKVLPSGVDRGADQVTAHLGSLQSSAQMLLTRVTLLHNLLSKVADGTAEYDHSLVRQAAGLLSSMPSASGSHFKHDYLTECNDAMLGVYLSSMTKGVYHMHEVIEKLNIVYESGSGGRRYGPNGPRAPPSTFAGPSELSMRLRNVVPWERGMDPYSGAAA